MVKTLLRLCAVPVAFTACAAAAPPPNTLAALFADGLEVVDLTHTVSADAPFWPGPAVSPFSYDTLSAHDDGAPSMGAYSVPEHFGTHFDAPVHGGAGLASVDLVSTKELFGPAVVIDVTAQALVGVDTGSVDPGNAQGFPAHGVVNGSGRFHLENLDGMSRLPESGAYLIVAPIKIQGGSGGQVRVFAVLP
ncbi:MAG: cyclase family protein [Gemmatimonadetes bacterium]|nr:cyclase family protein [Gemmatimonadota bacterium]